MPIIADPFNELAQTVAERLHKALASQRLPEGLFVVLGGDGFMLKTIRQQPKQAGTYLGLNCGRVGFLMNDIPVDISELVEMIMGPVRTLEFPQIAMNATSQSGAEYSALAVNDIYLERMTGQSAHMKININGDTVVERLVADGLICCTALGSTAYHFSAGGSACHPTLPVMGVTPICPHNPILRPVLVPLSATIDVEVIEPERRPIRAVADGRDHDSVLTIRIQDAKAPVRFAFLPGHDFTQTLIRKILQ